MLLTIEVPELAAASLLSYAVWGSALCFPKDGDEQQRRDHDMLIRVHEQIEAQIIEGAMATLEQINKEAGGA